MVVANLFGVLEGPELLIILAVVLLLFGGKKLPELARSLGQAKRDFHEAVTEPAATADEPASTPAIEEAPGSSPAEDSITISRAELDRLRAAAQAHDRNPN
jgi:sec-independent protein translocase protein TatA